jgi:GNAT superfamily N-acetyltransferase
MTVVVQPCTIADIREAGTFPQLAAEYAAESLIDGMPSPMPDWDAYAALEAAGRLFAFGAAINGALVGFLGLLIAKVPRYAEPIATTESFFVAEAHRKGGAGLKLLRAAEAKAREVGAAGVLVSAPTGGRLAEVLPRSGYRETNRVFFRKVQDG